MRAVVLVAALLAGGACQRNSAPPSGAVSAGTRDGGPTGVVARIGEVTGVWADFTPAEGGVTVSVPGVPEPNHHEQVLAGQVFREHEYFVATADRGIAYAIGVAELPAGTSQGVPLDVRLDKGATRVVGPGARGRADTPSFAGDVPALDVRATTEEGLVLRARVVAVGDRIYTISVTTRPEHASAPEIPRFLASLRVR